MSYLYYALIVLIALVAIAAGAIAYGSWRWEDDSKARLARLEAARIKSSSTRYSESEIESLPVPVQRYFRRVLKDSQAIIAAVSVEHVGTINMSESGEQWKPFTSKQRVITRRAGFDWNARVMMMPGVPVRVHDAYIAGEGSLRAALLGLMTVAKFQNSLDLNRGELMRFFMEAVWYPTALLPSQGVRWEAVDDQSAKGTLTDDGISLTLLFRFNGDGLIDTVRAAERGRLVAGAMTFSPWQGRFWNYALRDGMLVPLNGEVAWLLPGQEKTYYRGVTSKLTYDFVK